MIRECATAVTGVMGAVISSQLGGWDSALQTLVIFMAVDYITGLTLAGVFRRSCKSKTGTLSSKCNWQGLTKKGIQLLFVLIGYRLDIMLSMDFVRMAVIIAFTSNELLSITENAGLMGVPIPAKLRKAIDILNASGGEKPRKTDDTCKGDDV